MSVIQQWAALPFVTAVGCKFLHVEIRIANYRVCEYTSQYFQRFCSQVKAG
jgi:hypothetical protein